LGSFIAQPDDSFRLGDFLIQGLKNDDWTTFRAAVAFAKRSGTRHILDALRAFAKRGTTDISIGIDAGGTSAEGLLDLIDSGARSWIFHNANNSTFHPKVFLFKSKTKADLVIGSGNLTEGGLYSNYEAAMRTVLDLTKPDDAKFLDSIETALDRWSTSVPKLCLRLNERLLRSLVNDRKVLPEAFTRETEETGRAPLMGARASRSKRFRAHKVQRAPRVRAKHKTPSWLKQAQRKLATSGTVGTAPSAVASGTFLMTLQNTDVGYGKKTPGVSGRSPEIFIPMRAVDANPIFWKWPAAFSIDKAWAAAHGSWIAKKKKGRKPGRPLEKRDRLNVVFGTAHAGKVIARIWYNPDKIDIRIRHEKLRMAGQIGDILTIAPSTAGSGVDYNFEVVRKADPRFATLDIQCNQSVPNSAKRYAYV
jgi:HKD family nuclease